MCAALSSLAATHGGVEWALLRELPRLVELLDAGSTAGRREALGGVQVHHS